MILKTNKLNEIHQDLVNQADRNERIFLIAVQTWFQSAASQVQKDLQAKFAKGVETTLTDWEKIEANGKTIIKPATLEIMQKGGKQAFKHLAIAGDFEVINVYSVAAAEKFCAKLVKDVTAKTKKGIAHYVSMGIKEGKSMPKIARELRPFIGLTKTQTSSVLNYRNLLEDPKKFPGLTGGMIDKKVQRYAEKTHRRRMQTIARTETARAQNLGYCEAMVSVGVVETEFSPYAGCCPSCSSREKTRYDIKEAAGIIPVHPNCRCALLPVVDDSSVSKPLKQAPSGSGELLSAEPGVPSWKDYLVEHSDEKSTSAVLYDFYKVQYETTGKLSASGLKYLKHYASKFEASSVKISKPISGIGTQTVKIRPIDPPDGIHPLKAKTFKRLNREDALSLGDDLFDAYTDAERRTAGYLEAQAALFTHGPSANQVVLYRGNKICGAVATHIEEKTLVIDHLGTIGAPKGAGAELMRYAVARAYAEKLPMGLESTLQSQGFYARLGFVQDKKLTKIFTADKARVGEIKNALGSTGRFSGKVPKPISTVELPPGIDSVAVQKQIIDEVEQIPVNDLCREAKKYLSTGKKVHVEGSVEFWGDVEMSQFIEFAAAKRANPLARAQGLQEVRGYVSAMRQEKLALHFKPVANMKEYVDATTVYEKKAIREWLTGSIIPRIHDSCLTGKKFTGLQHAFQSALEKAPRYKGAVWRGASTSDMRFFTGELKLNSEVNLRSFLSSSRETGIAHDFILDKARIGTQKKAEKVLFKFIDKDGKSFNSIEGIAVHFEFGYDVQKEVVIQAGSKWKVVKISGIKSTKKGLFRSSRKPVHYQEIWLENVSTPTSLTKIGGLQRSTTHEGW